ncbi:MAG: metallophosphoesterase [Promethearchaeota archaeon]
MKILYVTDIHGIKWKYEQIYRKALSLKADLVINGGDMLPFGDFLKQDDFIINFLNNYFSRFEEAKIYYLGMMGNDDLLIFDDLFEKICNKYHHIHSIAQRRFKFDKFEIIGMNWVTDLPFALKDRARKDTSNFIFPKQLGTPVISSPNGWITIKDWYSYVENLRTIEEELKDLVIPDKMDNTIYVFHMPPINLGLDICHDGRKVGSKAIYDFIKERQPKITLHGHIHESPKISGQWYSFLDKTLCIQPGQSLFFEKNMIYCIIDTEKMNYKRLSLKKI